MLFKVDPDPGKEIEVDPDPDPRRGSKWIRIRIRPNVVDPGGSGSGSGSETLVILIMSEEMFSHTNYYNQDKSGYRGRGIKGLSPPETPEFCPHSPLNG